MVYRKLFPVLDLRMAFAILLENILQKFFHREYFRWSCEKSPLEVHPKKEAQSCDWKFCGSFRGIAPIADHHRPSFAEFNWTVSTWTNCNFQAGWEASLAAKSFDCLTEAISMPEQWALFVFQTYCLLLWFFWTFCNSDDFSESSEKRLPKGLLRIALDAPAELATLKFMHVAVFVRFCSVLSSISVLDSVY